MPRPERLRAPRARRPRPWRDATGPSLGQRWTRSRGVAVTPPGRAANQVGRARRGSSWGAAARSARGSARNILTQFAVGAGRGRDRPGRPVRDAAVIEPQVPCRKLVGGQLLTALDQRGFWAPGPELAVSTDPHMGLGRTPWETRIAAARSTCSAWSRTFRYGPGEAATGVEGGRLGCGSQFQHRPGLARPGKRRKASRRPGGASQPVLVAAGGHQGRLIFFRPVRACGSQSSFSTILLGEAVD